MAMQTTRHIFAINKLTYCEQMDMQWLQLYNNYKAMAMTGNGVELGQVIGILFLTSCELRIKTPKAIAAIYSYIHSL